MDKIWERKDYGPADQAKLYAAACEKMRTLITLSVMAQKEFSERVEEKGFATAVGWLLGFTLYRVKLGELAVSTMDDLHENTNLSIGERLVAHYDWNAKLLVSNSHLTGTSGADIGRLAEQLAEAQARIEFIRILGDLIEWGH